MSEFQYEAVVPSTAFPNEIVQNAGEDYDLVLPGALAGVRGNARGNLRSIAIVSVQKLAWEVYLWHRSTGSAPSTIDGDSFVGRWSFTESDGEQIAGAGSYRYYIDGLDVPYRDDDNTGKLHLTLVNRSAAAKVAGNSGKIVLKFVLCPPVFGWAGS